MSFQGMLKGRKAYKAHGKGRYQEALKLYDEAYNEGMVHPQHMLGYTVLLLRDRQYQKAREILVAMQNNPALNPVQKNQLFINYAAAVFRMGELEKGVRLLERQHAHSPSGLVYQTLGYLYVEKFLPENTPDFDALEAEAEAAKAQAARDAEWNAPLDAAPEEAPEGAPAEAPEAPAGPGPREAWAEAKEKAAAFLKEALEYDEDDSVCLDNMAQWLYRVEGDKAAARPWFEKAIKQKANQLDTLWFLSRYDLEEGKTRDALEKLDEILEGRFSPLNYVNPEMVKEEIARIKG